MDHLTDACRSLVLSKCVGAVSGTIQCLVAANLLYIIFSVYVLGIILVSVVTAINVDFDILLGAASVYLLIGVVDLTMPFHPFTLRAIVLP